MLTLMIVIFVLGYLAIALEHPLKIDKAGSALITGVLVWTFFVMTGVDHAFIEKELFHHLSEISSILFFLMGAMTIVELIDAHEGFSIITDKIKTKKRVPLLWIISILTFFFSAALDNLTTSIVMISLLRKLIDDKHDRWFFAGFVIIAANAGGAWSPIGDVTTTMLWIGEQLTTMTIIKTLIIPSLVAMLVPLLILTFTLKGEVNRPEKTKVLEHYMNPTTPFERNLVFFLGLAGLLFVPIFKTWTHLPPFMGMMFSLGVLWIVTEIIHRKKNTEGKSQLSVIGVLRKVDTASVLFFLGILLAVAGLQTAGHLAVVAESLNVWFGGDIYAINVVIGLLSAIVDNVPLVAGAMGMYEVASVGDFAQDGTFWQFLAFCAGTGGSALIIGSASGVAVMGLEKIDFVWYLKKISILALIGYFSGAGTYILLQSI
ncbi:sodium:proton antiporter NhaD [Flavobacteriales bacterium]|jgi:Na+/H+ antiporter NhaD/arsenite permease-like protein|nr:sodium:proton antiporter NhaD [Flavobacteriales bacterium]